MQETLFRSICTGSYNKHLLIELWAVVSAAAFALCRLSQSSAIVLPIGCKYKSAVLGLSFNVPNLDSSPPSLDARFDR